MEKPLGGKVQNQTFPPSLQIAQKTHDSHFPTAATTAGLGYIPHVSTVVPKVTFLNGLTRPGFGNSILRHRFQESRRKIPPFC
jgi:hypothetical protein